MRNSLPKAARLRRGWQRWRGEGERCSQHVRTLAEHGQCSDITWVDYLVEYLLDLGSYDADTREEAYPHPFPLYISWSELSYVVS